MTIMKSTSPVYVTGMGIVSGIGHNIEQFTQCLREGKAHYLIEDILLPRRQTLPSHTAFLCCQEAWHQAHLHEKPIPSRRLGLVIGGQNINQNLIFAQHDLFKQEADYLLPSYAIQFLDTDLIGYLSEQFKIHGEGCTVGGASASGNMAIIQGMRLIRLGALDACVVVGALADLSPLERQAFKQYGALSELPTCNPFDKSHSGFVYGQASACLILESHRSVAQRKIPILGSLLGYGLCLDGNRLATPSLEGEVTVMLDALRASGKEPSEIQYLNPHGTSSVLGDETEAGAIKKIWGNLVDKPWINTTKSLTGHCLWSAGVVEAIATLIQMQQGFMHPNPFLTESIEPALKWVGAKPIFANIDFALSNSFGFGGINTSIVLARAGVVSN